MKNKTVILSLLISHFAITLSAMQPGKYPPHLKASGHKATQKKANPCACESSSKNFSGASKEQQLEAKQLEIFKEYLGEESQVIQIAQEIHEIAYADQSLESGEPITFENFPVDRRKIIAWLFTEPKKGNYLKDQIKKYLSNLAILKIQETNNIDELIILALAFDDLEYWKCDLYSRIMSKISVEELTPNQLSLIAFACRKIQPLNRCGLETDLVINFFNKLKYKAIKILSNNEFTCKEIGLTLKSFTQTCQDYKDYDLFQLAQQNIIKLLGNQKNIDIIDAEDIKNILWSFAYPKAGQKQEKIKAFKIDKIKYIDISELQKILKLLTCRKLETFNSKQLSMVVRSFTGQANIDGIRAVYSNIYYEAFNNTNKFKPEEIVTIIKSFSEVNDFDQHLLIELIKKVKDYKFESSDLVRLAGSMLIGYCLNIKEENLIEKLIGEFLTKIVSLSPENWKPEELSEIHTIYRLYTLKSGDSFALPEDLSVRIKESLKKQENPQSSGFHNEVAGYLNDIKPGLVNEHPFESYFLDIVYIEEKIAFEVDGPFHFILIDSNPVYRNKNIIKETMLKLQNWRLLRIAHFDWPKDNQTRIQFLYSKLSTIPKPVTNKHNNL